ncbi:MAG: TPM domain-containing protein [Spirochaetes bacterium]|nr:TPM domain-containing protein [Spirochaetota bacterium]
MKKSFLLNKLLKINIIALVVFSAAFIYADYPEYTDLYINDFNNVFSPAQAAEMRSILTGFKTEKGIEAVLVTIDFYSKYETGDETFEQFATHLFNKWGVGDAVKNNGIMFLLSVNDRKVRIELGKGYDRSYDSEMQQIIDRYMLPNYKENMYFEGTLEGISAVSRKMLDRENIYDKMTAPFYVYLIGLFAVIMAVVLVVKRILRYRPRRCPKCRGQMNLIPETLDDSFLQNGQVKEEAIQSVDYDVWKCQSCSEVSILKYSKLFSFYKYCPKCSFRTVRVTSRTISAATYSSSGTGEREYNCTNCDYHRTETYVIPMKVESSSSSSSGSFGGGSSSGGGASGSW